MQNLKNLNPALFIPAFPCGQAPHAGKLPVTALRQTAGRLLFAASMVSLVGIPRAMPAPPAYSERVAVDPAHARVGVDLLGAMRQTGQLQPIAASDLLPAAQARLNGASSPALYLEQPSENGVLPLPVPDASGLALWTTTPDGTPVAIATESAHRWSAAWAQSRMVADAAWRVWLRDNGFLPARDYARAHASEQVAPGGLRELPQKVENLIRIQHTMAARMHLDREPLLYIAPGIGMAESLTTREGAHYLFIDADYLHQLPNELLAELLAHEDAHIRHGETGAAGIARFHNDPALERSAELGADALAVSREGTNDPALLAWYFNNALQQEIQRYNATRPSSERLVTPRQIRAHDQRQSGLHPSYTDRIEALRRIEAHLDENGNPGLRR